MKLSDFSFPGHVCWTFNRANAANPQLERFKQRAIEFLPIIYFSNITNIPKPRPNNQIHVNLQRLIRAYGSMSEIVLELKRIIQHTRWNFSWIVLVAIANFFSVSSPRLDLAVEDLISVYNETHKLFSTLI